ncbi:MAG: hypothetical protein AAFX76_13905, partial [Planctomycetota bacterium]
LAERLRLAVRGLAIDHPGSSAAPVVTVSVGLATGGQPDEADEPELPTASSVVLAADRMLYRAKHAGRDRVIAA